MFDIGLHLQVNKGFPYQVDEIKNGKYDSKSSNIGFIYNPVNK
jgi:hypothetical protein